MSENEIILSSTRVDFHGDKLTKEALENAAETINSERRPRLGLDHVITFPPMGRISNAKLVRKEDDEYYLVGEREFFDQRDEVKLDDGTELIKESFSNGGTPFAEVQFISPDEIGVSVDKSNFESQENVSVFFQQVENETSLRFEKRRHARKSQIPDPEIIFTLTYHFTLFFLGTKLFPKIADKVSDVVSNKISGDVASLYDLIKASIKGMVKYTNSKNRPITYIINMPADIHVELVIQTDKPGDIESALSQAKINELGKRTQHLLSIFEVEKIQFILDDNKEWKLNYLLSASGEAIGTKESFDKRDKALKKMIQGEIDNNESTE